MSKISNDFLNAIILLARKDTSLSLKDCCKKLKYPHTRAYNWYKSLKDGKWQAGYNKTEDGQPLEEELINEFINIFVFTHNSSKILKRLVTDKCLNDRRCFSAQMKILKSIFKKYPNIDFWLSVDFGEKRDNILFYIGRHEKYIHQKYLDFTAKDKYTKFKYNYKPKEEKPKKKTKKNLWDYY